MTLGESMYNEPNFTIDYGISSMLLQNNIETNIIQGPVVLTFLNAEIHKCRNASK